MKRPSIAPSLKTVDNITTLRDCYEIVVLFMNHRFLSATIQMIELTTKNFESYFTIVVNFARFYKGKVLFKPVIWHHSLQFSIKNFNQSGTMKWFDENFLLFHDWFKEY